MAKRSTPSRKADAKGSFTLGRSRFEKISAVEGIVMTADSRRMFADFDKRGLSNAERRSAIYTKHSKKA